MQGKKEICVLILGDFSPCLEHILRAYYILKTGRDSKFFVEECENIGIETTIRKKEKIRVHLQVATTRRKTSQLPADEIRTNEYKNRFSDVDLILICFYQNNQKTIANIRSKYVNELEQWYPKVPYYLMGLTINELKDGVIQPLRETISIEDRWLKRDLDVSVKTSKTLSKTIKSKGYLQCTFLAKEPLLEKEVDASDVDIEQCGDVGQAIDKAIKNTVKRSYRTCIVPF